MTGRPEVSRLLPILWARLSCALAGCHLEPADTRSESLAVAETGSIYAAGAITPDHPRGTNLGTPNWLALPPDAMSVSPPKVVEVARTSTTTVTSPAPTVQVVAPAAPTVVVEKTPEQQANALLARNPSPDDATWQSITAGLTETPAVVSKVSRLRAPILIRDEIESPIATQTPVIPTAGVATAGSDMVQSGNVTPEPPIRSAAPAAGIAIPLFPTAPTASAVVPGAPVPPATSIAPAPLPAGTMIPIVQLPPAAAATPAATSAPTSTVPSGPIVIGGRAVTFETLAQLVDGSGGGPTDTGCSSCGSGCAPGRPCYPGIGKCEPFPSDNCFERALGIAYNIFVCPDPCYEPKYEPIADSAFFAESARPVSRTIFTWDYFSHFAYPDRAEYLWAAPTAPWARAPVRSMGSKPSPTSTTINWH